MGLEPAAVDPAEIDEGAFDFELPPAAARRLAAAKARCVAARHPAAVVIAADTIVACGRRALPKAMDEATARECLNMLSGRRHRVLTGVAAIGVDGRRAVRLAETVVTFKRLQAGEIAAYIKSGEWHGKAGGYAIQGLADAFVKRINGSYSNVVGLPLHDTANILIGLGYPLWTRR